MRFLRQIALSGFAIAFLLGAAPAPVSSRAKPPRENAKRVNPRRADRAPGIYFITLREATRYVGRDTVDAYVKKGATSASVNIHRGLLFHRYGVNFYNSKPGGGSDFIGDAHASRPR